MAKKSDGTMVCPYYTCNDAYAVSVNCEGVETGSTIKYKFKNRADYENHANLFCRNVDNWYRCPYAMAVSAAYKCGHKTEPGFIERQEV